MKKHVMFTIGFLSLLGTHSLYGDIVTVNFEGVVSSVNDPVGDFPGVMIGDPVTGTYSYDTDSVDELPADLPFGRYASPIPPAMFSISVGPLSFQAENQVTVGVGNNNGGPKDTLTITGLAAKLLPNVGLALYFEDPTGTAYSDDTLPLDAPNLTQFTFTFGNVLVEANSSSVGFDFTSVVLAPDPIPAVSTWGLVACGMLLLTTATIILRRHPVLSVEGSSTRHFDA